MANRPDQTVFTVFEVLLESVAPIRRPRGRPRRHPAKLHADQGYDERRCLS